MSVRKLPGTPTVGGLLFWKDVAEEKGWRIQYNQTLDAASPLKPYRLLGPDNTLWASADTASEMQDALPELIEHCKHPMMTSEHVAEALMLLLKVAALAASSAGNARSEIPTQPESSSLPPGPEPR